MTDKKTTETRIDQVSELVSFKSGQQPSGYTLYRADRDGTITDVVKSLLATDDKAAWQEVARLNGAKPTPSILQSLKAAYRVVPVYENENANG